MRLFIAQTIDGFIADADGSVGFLDAFPGEAYGFEAFDATVEAIVLGRATYDHVVSAFGWPYAGKRAAVVTSRPLPDERPDGVVAVAADPVAIAEAFPDAWLVGGGRTIALFLEHGLVRELRLFTVPVLLGRGTRLFPGARVQRTLRLVGVRGHADGVVETIYWRD